MNRHRYPHWYPLKAVVGLAALCLLALKTAALPAQDQEAPEVGAQERPPLAKFITLTSPVDDTVYGNVKNAALSLSRQAAQENRKAVLVLEITPGSSVSHHVQGLAKFLSSAELAQVRTVAWVPETVTGNNVVLALACNEIIMRADAELGDIGRGEPVDEVDQQFVLSMVAKRYNPKLSEGLVRGMMDPQTVVLKIQRQVGPEDDATRETQVVTMNELQRLLKTKAVVLKRDTIKEAGVVGLFSGEQARALDLLVTHTAESRAEIAELYNLPREAMREATAAGKTRAVWLIKIDGPIEPILGEFIERQIQRAIASGANLIIFEIDSPGGLLQTSQQLANSITNLDPSEVRTAAYVPRQALSGAAIIALGCDEIYLETDAQIGDAQPIEIGAGGQFEKVPAKILSKLRADLRILAERKGRPAAIAEAMADPDLTVYRVTNRENGRTWYMTEDEIAGSGEEWIKGRPIPESREGNLLTVDGDRAHELKLAEPAVRDFDELKQRLGITPDVNVVVAGRTWVDTLVFILNHPMSTFLLIVIGIACIYLELHLMTGMLGIVSALCFALFFWSRYLGGTAGWLEVVLFLLGLACLALELFVIPGFGVFGVSGGLLLLASLILASQTFGNIEPNRDFSMFTETLGTLSASLAAVVIMAFLMSKYLPEIPFLNQMVLTPPGYAAEQAPDEPQLSPELVDSHGENAEVDDKQALVGQQGTTLSVLRPAGKAQIGGRYLDVVSDGPYINAGQQIQVVQVFGNRVVVREA